MNTFELMYLIKTRSDISDCLMHCCRGIFAQAFSHPSNYLHKTWESCLVKIFTHYVECLCTLLIVSFVVQRLCNSMWFPLGSTSCATNILFPKFLPTPTSWKVVYMCVYQLVSALQVLKLRSLFHFEQTYVQGKIYHSNFSLLGVITKFCHHCLS